MFPGILCIVPPGPLAKCVPYVLCKGFGDFLLSECILSDCYNRTVKATPVLVEQNGWELQNQDSRKSNAYKHCICKQCARVSVTGVVKSQSTHTCRIDDIHVCIVLWHSWNVTVVSARRWHMRNLPMSGFAREGPYVLEMRHGVNLCCFCLNPGGPCKTS